MVPPSDSFVSLGVRSFLATLGTQARGKAGVAWRRCPGSSDTRSHPLAGCVLAKSQQEQHELWGSTAPGTMHSLNLQDQSRKASHMALSSTLLPVLPCPLKSLAVPHEEGSGAHLLLCQPPFGRRFGQTQQNRSGSVKPVTSGDGASVSTWSVTSETTPMA